MGVDVIPTVIYSSMMGMTIFALFEVCSRPKQRQYTYLSGLLVLLLIHMLGELYIFSGFYQYAPAIAGAHFPFRMLLGPALFFYAYAAMSPDKTLPKHSFLLAFLGPLIVVIGMLPFAFGIAPADKLALANPATRDPELFKIALFTCLFCMITFIAFTGIYLAAAFHLQNNHRQQLMERFSNIEQRAMDWFKLVLILWGCVWFLYTLEFGLGFLGLKWFGSGVVLPIIEAFILMTFSHFVLKQPVLQEFEKGEPEIQVPRTASIDVKRMEQIASKLKTVMTKDALYLEEDLSLKRLSDAIAVSENHISETLSQFLNTNFFQFINSYRVELAMTLLSTTDKNVSSIAYESGFNSKSTFNTAFKKETGFTPTVYRNNSQAAA